MLMYCVYLTEYFGNKLPRFYVGSSSVEKVFNGYRGSVSSKQFKAIWLSELKEHPELFRTKIISTHETRKLAAIAELEYQLTNSVVDSPEYINKSLAQPDGFFGMDVSGSNNPMFGTIRTGETHKGEENISEGLKNSYATGKLDHMRKQASERMTNHNPSADPEIRNKQKDTWRKTKRNCGTKNGMWGKGSKLLGKKLYNDGRTVKAFAEGEQPSGWVPGRIRLKQK